MAKVPVVLFCILMASLANAFVNVESVRAKKGSEGWSGLLSLSGDKKDGNTRESTAAASVLGHYLEGSSEFLSFADYSVGKSNGEKYAESLTGHMRYTHFVEQKIAAESFIQVEQNKFTRLSYRALVGLGTRIKLLKTENTKGFFGLGAYYSEEQLEEVAGVTDEKRQQFWRYNSYVSLVWSPLDNFSITNVVYYQPKMGELEDYRIYETFSTDIAVTESLSFSLYYRLAYDNRPPQEVRKLDSSQGSKIKFLF